MVCDLYELTPEEIEIVEKFNKKKKIILENLTNAPNILDTQPLCHRDYFAPESNKVAVFKDRVEIYNPRQFPEGYNSEYFINHEEESILRNPIIAQILYYSKDLEKWASGLKRIYDECRANDVKLNLRQFGRDLRLCFIGRKMDAKWTKIRSKSARNPPQIR